MMSQFKNLARCGAVLLASSAISGCDTKARFSGAPHANKTQCVHVAVPVTETYKPHEWDLQVICSDSADQIVEKHQYNVSEIDLCKSRAELEEEGLSDTIELPWGHMPLHEWRRFAQKRGVCKAERVVACSAEYDDTGYDYNYSQACT